MASADRSRCTGALKAPINGPPSVRPRRPIRHEALPLRAPAESRPRVEIYPLFPLRRELRDRLVVRRCRWSQSLHAPNRAASRSPWHPWRCCCGSLGRIYTRHEATHLTKLRRTAAVARCVLTPLVHAKLAEVRSYEHLGGTMDGTRERRVVQRARRLLFDPEHAFRDRGAAFARPESRNSRLKKSAKIVPGELWLRSATALFSSYFWRRTRSGTHWRPRIRNSATRHSSWVAKT